MATSVVGVRAAPFILRATIQVSRLRLRLHLVKFVAVELNSTQEHLASVVSAAGVLTPATNTSVATAVALFPTTAVARYTPTTPLSLKAVAKYTSTPKPTSKLVATDTTSPATTQSTA